MRNNSTNSTSRRITRTVVATALASLTILFSAGIADAAVINGTGRSDQIIGTRSADRIDGKAGNDSINSGRGRDFILGGDGNDVIRSEKNDDFVNGGAGNDFIDGGSDRDRLFGGPGNDSIQGGKGDDRLNGGPGNDRLQGQGNTDIYTFDGKFGNDVVIDSSGNKDILIFPSVPFESARVVPNGKNNVRVITPNGSVIVTNQRSGSSCDRNIEGLIFRGGQQAQFAGVSLVPVKSIKKTNCSKSPFSFGFRFFFSDADAESFFPGNP